MMYSYSPIRTGLTKVIRVAREQGGLEVLRKASRRFQSSVELRTASLAVRFGGLTGLSDKALMRQVEPRWDDLDGFIGHLRTKDCPAFPFPPGARETFLALLSTDYPQEAAQTINDAERICRHEFHTLGEDFLFPGTINWHLDPATGKSWPRQYVGIMKRWFWTEKRSRDALPLWELNRHQHLTTLGQAYWLTRDTRYVDEVSSQLTSWIEQNPYQFGINWFAVLEIGIRVISWSLAFYFFRESETFDDRVVKQFLKSLYQQTDFLRRNLTLDWDVQNNWLIGQATGLVTVGALFPEFLESRDWIETGLHILKREARRQTSTDGVNREQATGYHRFVLDLLLLVVILGRRGALPRVGAIEQVVESMLDYALYAMDPSGRLPQLGDTDEGWGFRFSETADYWDLRAWLAVGAVLFHRPEFKFASRRFPEEALWLLGQRGQSDFSKMAKRTPDHMGFAFDAGGHYVIRDDWTQCSDFLIIRSGDFGLGGEGACAHAHCDLLSFVLWIAGEPVIVDSGTYTYHGQWRDRFRLTSAHNTLLIDGKDQAVPTGEFSWVQVPQATCEYWSEDRIIGSLDVHGVTVTREIYHPETGSWQISDTLSGEKDHTVKWLFHFAPDLSVRPSLASDHLTVEVDSRPCVIVRPPEDVEVHVGRGWYSASYGHKKRNPVLVATWRGEISVHGIRFDWRFRNVKEQSEEC